MRVKENFYETEDMVILQSMDNGYLYSDILMKLYLKSLKYEGKLIFKEHIPYNTKMIATITGHNIDVVEKSLRIFKELNLIDVLDNGAIYMLDIQNFIGKTSTEADRIKDYRKRITKEKTINGVQMYDERTPKTETEQEIELETELEQQHTEIEKILKNNFENEDIEAIRKYCIENNVVVNVVVEKIEIINHMKKIRNKVGALLTAIKEDWKPSKEANNTISKFNNFEGREYDYDSLEKKLLGWDDEH